MSKFSRTPIISYRCKWSLHFVFCATAAEIPDLRTAVLMNFILKIPLVNKASLPLDTYNMQSYHNNFEKSSVLKLHFGDIDTHHAEVLFTVLTFYILIRDTPRSAVNVLVQLLHVHPWTAIVMCNTSVTELWSCICCLHCAFAFLAV